MKAFVTGGTGFIGRRLVERLLGEGREVTCLVRRSSDHRALEKGGARIAFGDILSKRTVSRAMAGSGTVFHLAAWYELGIWNRRRMFETNVIGTRNVLEAAKEAGKKVVYCSTAGICGYSSDRPVNEYSKRQEGFTSEYERTKLLAHREAMRLAQEGLDVSAIMPGAVFGPGDSSIIGEMMRQYVQGRLRFFVRANPTFSWVHVDDVVGAFLLIEAKGGRGEPYIVTDRYMSILELLDRLEAQTAVPLPKRFVGTGLLRVVAPFSELKARLARGKAFLSREAVSMLEHDWLWDSTKIREELGWKPADFDGRLRDTIAWYIGNHKKPAG